MPDYNWDLTAMVGEARFKEYDDSFNEADLEDEEGDEE